ncbi:MAG: phosphotransferase family protein, partial [Pseudomonadota bacterium]
ERLIPYWEVLAAARWAVVALLQGERHITGGEPSIELLLTGVMAPQMEYEALEGIVALESA